MIVHLEVTKQLKDKPKTINKWFLNHYDVVKKGNRLYAVKKVK